MRCALCPGWGGRRGSTVSVRGRTAVIRAKGSTGPVCTFCVCLSRGRIFWCETQSHFGLQTVYSSTLIYIAEWSHDTILLHRQDADG